MPITNIKEWELYRAALAGNVGVVKDLLSQKMNQEIQLDIDVNFDDDGTTNPINGSNALYVAAKLGQVEIVELLLNAGANPNEACRVNRWTPLSIAVSSRDSEFEDKKAIITLLLEHGANPDISDSEGATPIDHCTTNELEELLKQHSKGGALHINQGRLIQNYNFLVNALRSQGICNLTNAKNNGICAGLSQQFIFYEKQNRSSEFIFFLSFISSLTDESINHLVAQYKINKSLAISVANNDSDEIFLFEKLLHFMEGINLTQLSQQKTLFKGIQVNLDSTQILACTEEKVVDVLIESELMKSGEFKLISLGAHLIALHRTPNATYLYDPNSFKGPILCRMDEVDLYQMIKPYFSPDGHIILSVFDISYGDLNRELDDIISDFKEVIHSDKIMQGVYLNYQVGKISRTDLAYCLKIQLDAIVNDPKFSSNDKLHELHHEINMYIATQRENNIISPGFGSIDKAHGKANLLQTACRYGKVELVKHLISDCGADINDQSNPNKMTPLYFATAFGQVSVVKELLKMGADPTLKSIKGQTPLALAEMNAKKGGQYSVIAELISAHLSMIKMMEECKADENDLVAIKLAKFFTAYAHPPLLSFHWRSHRQLADTIAKTLRDNDQWSAGECNTYITKQLQAHNVKPNSSGTLHEVIRSAKLLIDQHLHREESGNAARHSVK